MSWKHFRAADLNSFVNLRRAVARAEGPPPGRRRSLFDLLGRRLCFQLSFRLAVRELVGQRALDGLLLRGGGA